MDVELLRQLDHGLFALDRGYRHFRLESRAVVPARSSCHGILLARSIMLPLRGKSTYPGCSDFRSRLCICAPKDIERTVLLHSMARLEDWPAWQAHAGAKFDNEKGLRFENSALAYEAAIKGAGIALAVKDFVAPSLEDGRLVALFDETFVTGKAYYLIWPKNAAASLPLKRFVTWVRDGHLSKGVALPSSEQ